jgi:hypothetical protein
MLSSGGATTPKLLCAALAGICQTLIMPEMVKQRAETVCGNWLGKSNEQHSKPERTVKLASKSSLDPSWGGLDQLGDIGQVACK